MSEHTPTPWTVSSAICGKHDTETVSIYHYPHEAACYEVVETGCKCGDEALTKANARHIVHCVNNHERLVEALEECRDAMESFNRAPGATRDEWEFECEVKEVDELLAQLQAGKGGE